MEEIDASLITLDASLREFLATARSCDLKRWWLPNGDDDWLPARTVERLNLSYREFWGMLEEGGSGQADGSSSCLSSVSPHKKA